MNKEPFGLYTPTNPKTYQQSVDKLLKSVDKSYFGRIWTKLDCNLDFMLAVTNGGIKLFFN